MEKLLKMNRSKKFIASGILSAGAIFSHGCFMPDCRLNMPPKVLEQRLERGDGEGYFEGGEGLEPWSECSVHQLVSEIGSEFNLVYNTYFGLEEMVQRKNYMKKADSNSMKKFRLGYSKGTEDMWNMLKEDEKNGVEIDVVFYLDPTHKNNLISGPTTKIPKNVKRIVVMRGENSGWFGGRDLTKDDLEDSGHTSFENHTFSEADHLGLPYDSRVYEEIRHEILDALRR